MEEEERKKKREKGPEIQGVRTPSPITMEVPSIVANRRNTFAK